jgi:hypothetical protein
LILSVRAGARKQSLQVRDSLIAEQQTGITASGPLDVLGTTFKFPLPSARTSQCMKRACEPLLKTVL